MIDPNDVIDLNGYPHLRYFQETLTEEEMIERSRILLEQSESRRSVREYSDKPIPYEVVENILKTASSAPSGANKQPWTFCVIKDPKIKKQIRDAAEKEEKLSYESRMSERWLKDLEPLGTDPNKPFLETAPYLIIVFKRVYEIENGEKHNNYYVNESVGLACGMLISAIHNAGLVTLTHTPSPMNFLQKILDRPDNERAFLLLPIGYPADKTYVPKITKKSTEEYIKIY
ncbi:nitroreductase family protein [Marinigracilibium pacificum]|uniref:Nitroreductase family protein n=1 Tax=Marinigracilibium pacificum TaxID=2729599 RepID=A0A848J492_9BACT|nr:nitroreductase family protein [Marinigracilibium pacificum]NMM49169.1 nitroreductase family protein [Marinigracilibium pacificum]